MSVNINSLLSFWVIIIQNLLVTRSTISVILTLWSQLQYHECWYFSSSSSVFVTLQRHTNNLLHQVPRLVDDLSILAIDATNDARLVRNIWYETYRLKGFTKNWVRLKTIQHSTWCNRYSWSHYSWYLKSISQRCVTSRPFLVWKHTTNTYWRKVCCRYRWGSMSIVRDPWYHCNGTSLHFYLRILA